MGLPLGDGVGPPDDERVSILWRIGAFLWWGLFVVLAILIVRDTLFEALHRLQQGVDVPAILDLLLVLLWIALVFGAFWFASTAADALGRWIRAWTPPAPTPGAPPPRDGEEAEEGEPGVGFPAPVTLVAGGWLLVTTAGSIAALLVVISRPLWLQPMIDPEGRVDDLLVAMMAGGVGGSISAIIAFLKHASELKDFRVSYLPWYLLRPVLGALLGVVGFFCVKGGLLVALPGTQGEDFNDYGLAAICSLIGLFSKNALEKLREIAHVVFTTRDDVLREKKNGAGGGEGGDGGNGAGGGQGTEGEDDRNGSTAQDAETSRPGEPPQQGSPAGEPSRT